MHVKPAYNINNLCTKFWLYVARYNIISNKYFVTVDIITY